MKELMSLPLSASKEEKGVYPYPPPFFFPFFFFLIFNLAVCLFILLTHAGALGFELCLIGTLYSHYQWYNLELHYREQSLRPGCSDLAADGCLMEYFYLTLQFT